MKDQQIFRWAELCQRFNEYEENEIIDIKSILLEGKSPLLNACAKEFGQEVVYDKNLSFELTEKTVNALFRIIDNTIFNKKLSKLKNLKLYVGNPTTLNPIIQTEYAHNPNFDLEPYLAVYVPDVSPKEISPGKHTLEKHKDGIFINLDNHKYTTLAYAIATICHEMIHCLDANEGTLLEQTAGLIDKYAPYPYVDYMSHFTSLFIAKKANLKTHHGITI